MTTEDLSGSCTMESLIPEDWNMIEQSSTVSMSRMMLRSKKLLHKMASIGIAVCLLTAVMTASAASDSTVIQAEDVEWGYLNPLRGKLSPGAADLWGDRSKDMATGMLVRFNKGFSSPPHIHNISYRGVVIEGKMHNDDPGAESMWLPALSFWSQPAGENHITAASGERNLIYLEIDSGPYLVQPAAQQFDNGERPINVHADNLVWLDEQDLSFIHGPAVSVASLWQAGSGSGLHGSLLKLPAGFQGNLATSAEEFRAVVISGVLTLAEDAEAPVSKLSAGSYFSASGEVNYGFTTAVETVIYIRSDQSFTVMSN
ncbi:MAG: DUF4437 domain-containing protein [Rickettsiales bacterium]